MYSIYEFSYVTSDTICLISQLPYFLICDASSVSILMSIVSMRTYTCAVTSALILYTRIYIDKYIITLKTLL